MSGIDLGEPGELEGANAVEQVISSYDRESGEWSLETSGPFWEAIKIAHRAKRTGRGTSIAILDGWYDTTIPRLRDKIRSRQLCNGASSIVKEHGTAVALLISAVAPDAKLDFYGICDVVGRPLPGLLADALELVAESDVFVVNLSAGYPRTWTDSFKNHRGMPSGFSLLDLQDNWEGLEDCLWCAPVDEAALHGKIVVTAVGNDEQKVYCPARSPYAIATGFRIENRILKTDKSGEAYEVGESGVPMGYLQSSEVAYTINQPEGMIGSSFSAPLLSGALALGIPSSEIQRWFDANHLGSMAHVALYSDNRSKQEVTSLLARAWSQVPHDHFSEVNQEPCFECSLFLETLYTAESLLWLVNGIHDIAEQRMKVNQKIMPWSPHAFINLGALLERRAAQAPRKTDTLKLIAEAIRNYEIAVDCPRPSLIAEQRLAKLKQSE